MGECACEGTPSRFVQFVLFYINDGQYKDCYLINEKFIEGELLSVVYLASKDEKRYRFTGCQVPGYTETNERIRVVIEFFIFSKYIDIIIYNDDSTNHSTNGSMPQSFYE